MAGRVITCEGCGKTFESEWTEEEANREMIKNFGEVAEEDRAVVCHACYLQIMEVMAGNTRH